MDFMEEAFVELKDGRRGLIVEIRPNEPMQYDVELPDGELTTVFHDEVAKQVHLPTR
ncbi:hypothetical protein [Sporosarcina sp. Marseille-Q4943]|uniref:hypothetical protein n=1 Tax=Sporosarcina sp. Marseille-Q4943 TaxID=2942204 RepID=UPI00208DDB7F|nr:hypothetical protein [Sporosarcina sp. Marseille-Q4943]